MTAELVLDRLFFILGAVLLPLSQERRQAAGEIIAVGRFAVGKKAGLPGRIGGIEHRFGIALKLLRVSLEFSELFFVFLSRQFDDRRCHADPGREPGRCSRFGHTVEGVEQRVVVGLSHRIVFMVVALGAGHREAEPRRARRVDPVEEVVEPLLLGNRAALAVQKMVAIEAAGDLLIESGLFGGGRRQQVARQLLGGKTVERHVGVEGLHHPVPPDPLPGVAILLEAVGIGVAGDVEPGERHSLAVVRAGKEAVDQFFVGLRIGVGNEGIDLLGRGWQADQISVEPADERGPVGLGRRFHSGVFQLHEHESIDIVLRPSCVLRLRWLRSHRRHEAPVRRVDGPFLDPAVEEFFLVVGEPPVGIRRRHDDVGVGRVDAFEQHARTRIARHDRAGMNRSLAVIELQVSLPLVAVLSVAIEAVLGEDRPDVAIEVERLSRRLDSRFGRPGRRPDRRHHRHPSRHHQNGDDRRSRWQKPPRWLLDRERPFRATHGTFP